MATTTRSHAGHAPAATAGTASPRTTSQQSSASIRPSGSRARRRPNCSKADGPNALPVEKAVPGSRRFLEQYRSYMQIILLAAAIVSLAIKEWSTGVLLLLITVLNAVVGLRQEGKAQSAMNALKAMVKASARVRRDGSEREIAAEEVVIGDVVLLAAGDDVPADGRITQASALQIDESALTGESVPASKGVEVPGGDDLAPGEQTDMAFMHTPVTHGSAVMIVTATGADTQVGKIAGMLATTRFVREHELRAAAIASATALVNATVEDSPRWAPSGWSGSTRSGSSAGSRPSTRCCWWRRSRSRVTWWR